MGQVRLRDYNNSWYHPHPGRPGAWQMAWFLIGLPLLRCSLLPFSGLRVRLLQLLGAEIGEDCWIDNLTTVRIGNDVCLTSSPSYHLGGLILVLSYLGIKRLGYVEFSTAKGT